MVHSALSRAFCLIFPTYYSIQLVYNVGKREPAGELSDKQLSRGHHRGFIFNLYKEPHTVISGLRNQNGQWELPVMSVQNNETDNSCL